MKASSWLKMLYYFTVDKSGKNDNYNNPTASYPRKTYINDAFNHLLGHKGDPVYVESSNTVSKVYADDKYTIYIYKALLNREKGECPRYEILNNDIN
jgi:hypothetical protein